MKTFIGIVSSVVTWNMYFTDYIREENKAKLPNNASVTEK